MKDFISFASLNLFWTFLAVFLILVIVIIFLKIRKSKKKKFRESLFRTLKKSFMKDAISISKKAKLRGYKEWQIRNLFLKKGWNDDEIDGIFKNT